LGSSIFIASCVLASALPSPFTPDELERARIELDWKINLAKCEARVLRDSRRINSRHPTVHLSYGCTEASGDRLKDARAVRDAWLASAPIRVVSNEDPMWQVEGWSAHDEDFEKKMLELRVDEDIRDRALIMGNPFLGQANGPSIFDEADIKRTLRAYKRRDAKKAKCADNDDEQDAIADDEEDSATSDDAEDTKAAKPLWDIKRKGDISLKGLNSEDKRTARIYNYGLWRADNTEEFRKATVTEDAAQEFTVHALHLIEQGKYEEQLKLRAWLGWVWKHWVWKGGLKRTIAERNTSSGFQPWEPNADDGRADTGRVLESSIMSDGLTQFDEFAQNDDDILTSVLSQRLAELRPELTSADLGLIEDLSAGATHEQSAKKRGISTKTVQRRLDGIKGKARKVNRKTAVEFCPLLGTVADVSASTKGAA
jgi:hypothetical protein